MEFIWTESAQQNLAALDTMVQKRIAQKMRWFSAQEDPLSFAEPITGEHGLFRYRIGAYRIFIRPDGIVLLVLRIRKRSEAYR